MKGTKPIWKKVRDYRLKFEMTQQQLADKLGVSRNQITRWENIKVKPNKYTEYFLKID